MAKPINIDELMEKIDSRFTLAVLAAARARQLRAYFNSLKAPLEKCDYRPPLVETSSTKPLTVAFKEVLQDKVTYRRKVDGIK
ncbi:hypothetical protein HKBW3S43_00541 [Candidatus Hakubella thermalkaliphila]|uniref:DNA-directed RNA polymerase subunit omega n=1 Tax=Candidatus Hakubella thermalkaliphila TaxID=2754717 RepID=A0A6V8PQ19_9ACTN|nr:DNA-directed RNA polymerase subunit omega [Candidatus Hakubella thermalkaliphila]MBT9170369.1 DNA-directed RNA polymerase subunit omega [Actinomycetota bacterium]GFP24578.1 hypothetical protein HKBW3S25_00016 [Candidatus Hakubella thermalkaliphila]GFP34749.1 hypothetical protein HKBW3S43_00541 [Candidatus Hakubella thermalkaliphila]